jgi:uncharacterized protein (DUF433 family)
MKIINDARVQVEEVIGNYNMGLSQTTSVTTK